LSTRLFSRRPTATCYWSYSFRRYSVFKEPSIRRFRRQCREITLAFLLSRHFRGAVFYLFRDSLSSYFFLLSKIFLALQLSATRQFRPPLRRVAVARSLSLSDLSRLFKERFSIFFRSSPSSHFLRHRSFFLSAPDLYSFPRDPTFALSGWLVKRSFSSFRSFLSLSQPGGVFRRSPRDSEVSRRFLRAFQPSNRSVPS
jgi:hypothetical protein